MKKLCEVAATKYFIDANESKRHVAAGALEEILKSNADEEIDLAGCRFGVETAQYITNKSKTCRMRNTEFKELDDILLHNYQIRYAEPLDAEEFRTSFASGAELTAYLHEVKSSGKNYKIHEKPTEFSNFDLYISIVVLLAYPEVVVDVGTKIDAIFREVRRVYLRTKVAHDEYLYVVGCSLINMKKDERGLFHVPMVGTFSEKELVSKFLVLPSEFGTVPLAHSEEFESTCRHFIGKLIQPKKKARKLRDYIASSYWEGENK